MLEQVWTGGASALAAEIGTCVEREAPGNIECGPNAEGLIVCGPVGSGFGVSVAAVMVDYLPNP
ncbi:MAG: hypothetical protein R2737_07425 [Candidatus Nanopelagicales bacterium]